mmetsp:Transcript_4626/g.13092  ORF Transcript_4626/g.13092 Transcript_4626/m.13092 type:complete len:504 (-) Transcript_4626:1238-2749(-)
MYSYNNSKPLAPKTASNQSKYCKALAVFLALAFVGIKYALSSSDNAAADVGGGGGKKRPDKISHIKTRNKNNKVVKSKGTSSEKDKDWKDMSKTGLNLQSEDDDDKESYDNNDDDDDFGNVDDKPNTHLDEAPSKNSNSQDDRNGNLAKPPIEKPRPTSSRHETKFPSLSSLTDGSKVHTDVSWMLDFAITGFAKCGTTWMMNYLRRNGRASGELWVNQGEVHFMRKPDGPAKMVKMMYKTHEADVAEGTKRLYGVKNPAEMEIEGSLGRYAEYFPQTKFIISLRHPVKWFESFFNFRQYHHYPHMVARPTSKLIGECEAGYPYKPKCMTSCPSGKMDVCTVRANFHWALSRLGKTPMKSKAEKALLQHDMSIDPMPNKVFIMEQRQIIYNHPSAKNFTNDVRDFLGLNKPLTELQPYVPPADKYAEFSNKEAVEHLIHICDEEHEDVRKELVRIGKEAATWITKYFLESEEVVVSSKAEFIKLMKDWGQDPCKKGRRHLLSL